MIAFSFKCIIQVSYVLDINTTLELKPNPIHFIYKLIFKRQEIIKFFQWIFRKGWYESCINKVFDADVAAKG